MRRQRPKAIKRPGISCYRELMGSKGDPEFMESLARGLRVMRRFVERERPLTIAEVSVATGLSRSSTRRCLHTLLQLGYVGQREAGFTLLPKVLTLGHAYISSSTLAMRAQPLLDQLRDTLHESCSLGLLEGDQVVYAARAEASRIMSVTLRVGSRLPLFATSMGRVLLAGHSRDEQVAYLAAADRQIFTDRTITDREELLAIFAEVAKQGFAIVDQELELGQRSIAVPVMRRAKVAAALNIGTQVARISTETLTKQFLPRLKEAASELSLLAAS